MPSLTRYLPAESDTLAFGAALAAGLEPGLVVYLIGELGAGKTTLARGLLRAPGDLALWITLGGSRLLDGDRQLGCL